MAWYKMIQVSSFKFKFQVSSFKFQVSSLFRKFIIIEYDLPLLAGSYSYSRRAVVRRITLKL